jgi:hypothetical protein
MAAAEAAIVTTLRALADFSQSLVERITAAEAIIRDPVTGLAATRAQLSEVDRLRSEGDAANAQSTATLSAQVNDQTTGLPATRAEQVADRQASAERDAANARSIDALSAQVNDPATGLPAARAQIVSDRNTSVGRDDALGRRIDTTSAKIGDTNAVVATLAEAMVDGDEANARLIQQVRASLGDLGEATVQDLIEAVVSETGRILAQRTVTIDVNGNVVGYSLIGSPDGPGALNLINTDLKMGTGRIVFDTGAVMWAMGLGFGKNSDLVSWFGPSMPLAQCTRANALEWKGTDLKQYFGGALSAGVIRNAVQTTLTTADASVSTGVVSSNGRKRTVILSYSYTRIAELSGFQQASSGGSSAQVKLYRNGVEIATLTAPGGWQRTARTSQGLATYSETLDGSLTIDDNSGGTSPEYRATLVVRSLGPGPATAPTDDAVSQSISIIQTEELPT